MNAAYPIPFHTAKEKQARGCLAVADCIMRLLESLPDGDLPPAVVKAMGEVSDATLGLVISAKRFEQGIPQ